YMNWIKHHEEKSETDEVTQLSRMPLISVVMSTYNTPTHYLQKAIQSVLTQSYPHWELCIADDASDNKETLQLLRSYQKESDKIHIQFRRENGHISAASNTALKMAQGEFIALMDHDDMLAPHALLEAVKAINQYPHAKLLYSDEDKIDEKGRRYDPHFKTEWNPDLFFSQNYLSHLTIMRKELFEQLGGFRSGYEGAQDYDLLLRSLDYLEEYEIIHIPGILYHWRAIEGSSALNSAEKPYTSEAGLLALKDYLYKRYPDTEVKLGMVPNTYKVVYPLQRVPLISLIIPTRDSYAILHKCIQSILEKTRYKNYEIIIIDNQTKDLKTLDYFKQLRSRYPIIRIVSYDKPFNYAAMNNFGATQARGELLGLINNDIEVISEEWLNEMVQHALRPGIGAVGAKLYYDDGTIQHAGVILGIGGVAGHSHKYFHRNDDGYFSRLKIIQNLSAVTSACLILRKKLYLEVGGMDAVYLKVAFNDVDLCLKIRQLGYRNLWTPYARLYHHESLSRGAEDTKEKKIRFAREVAFMQKKWGAQLQTDPYYSQYLTLR
ncbi:MAG TPA: glycosyltransferase family 2 protein, partial [Epsilonproteobacteria bacterium]|nr:glycosyltransferase family 2 protein [Campylobacterota bacterium]